MEELLYAAGAITALAAAAAVVWKFITTINAVIDGIKCQLRTDMMRTYYKCSDDHRVRQYEKENFEHNYSAYKALGGNSFIDDIHEQMRLWEVTT